MSTDRTNLIGAILCGGKSSRMGQPKEIMRLRSGKTLIEHVYNVLSRFCAKVVLSGNPEKLPASIEGLDRIHDRFKNIGPIGGLEALLSSGLAKEFLIIPCDLDQITVDVIRILAKAKGHCPIILRTKDQIEPLLGRYSSDMLPFIRNRIRNNLFSLKGILCDTEHIVIDVPDELIFSLNNVNTIYDFK